MKKTLFLILVILGLYFSAQAQAWRLNAYQYASKTNTAYGWTDWSDWIDTYVEIVVNPSYINIYSSSPQSYRVLQLLSVDNNTWKWQCVDYRNVYCIIRFKIDDKQLYIEYTDARWVYNFTM